MTKKWKNPEELRLASRIYWRVRKTKKNGRVSFDLDLLKFLSKKEKISFDNASRLCKQFADNLDEPVYITNYEFETQHTHKYEVSS